MVDNLVPTQDQIEVLSLPRKFVVTPNKPPDNINLKHDVMAFVEKIRWKYFFAKKSCKDNQPIAPNEKVFEKTPWYKKTDKQAPKSSPVIEQCLESFANNVMDPRNFRKFYSNIPENYNGAIKEILQWPKQYNIVTIIKHDWHG